MFIANLPVHPMYIKKEDVHSFLKQQRIRFGIVIGSMGAVITMLFWQVVPKLTAMYADFNMALPMQTQLLLKFLPVGAGLCIASAAYLILSSPNYTLLEPLLKKYKKGEMINANEFPLNRKYELLLLFIIAITIGVLVVSIIAPIYSLTESL